MKNPLAFRKILLLMIALISLGNMANAAFPVHTGAYTSSIQQITAAEDNGGTDNTIKKGNGWAIAAFACGIIGLLGFVGIPTPFFGIPAIIFGGIGMSRNRSSRGLAIAGLVLGIIEVVFIILSILFLAMLL